MHSCIDVSGHLGFEFSRNSMIQAFKVSIFNVSGFKILHVPRYQVLEVSRFNVSGF
jgi:hypothetical protein